VKIREKGYGAFHRNIGTYFQKLIQSIKKLDAFDLASLVIE
jgi:hypothetical protein